MIWVAFALLAFLMLWLAAEIVDECRIIYRRASIGELVFASLAVIGMGVGALLVVLVGVDAYWASR